VKRRKASFDLCGDEMARESPKKERLKGHEERIQVFEWRETEHVPKSKKGNTGSGMSFTALRSAGGGGTGASKRDVRKKNRVPKGETSRNISL